MVKRGENESVENPKGMHEQAWGIPYAPDEFVKAAVQAGHPHHIGSLVPPVLAGAISASVKKSKHQMCSDRAEWFRKWIKRPQELKSQESSLKKNLPRDVANILEPKRILLWKEMLEAASYPDMGRVDEVLNGTSLIGEVEVTGIFESKFKPAEITVEELKEVACHDRLSVFNSARSSGDDEVDKIVWEKTQEEVNCGWAVGPVPYNELPSHAVLSRRFGLRQPNKIRLIDDLSGSSINATVQTYDLRSYITAELPIVAQKQIQ